MTREKVKKLFPVIQAFCEGKAIESRCIKGDKSLWYDDNDLSFDDDLEYRIKPEPKYRSFKNAEECWNEMQKHQPLGWVKSKKNYLYSLITTITTNEEEEIYLNGIGVYSLDEVTKQYTFADGTPFGILEEK